MAYGQDNSIVYRRHTVCLHEESSYHYTNIRFGNIGFCGRDYPFIKVDDTYHYDEHLISEALKISKRDIREHFHRPRSNGLFREYGVPVYGGMGGAFYLNPRLQDYQFAKVIDPFQAYQQISMYIGGVLGKGNPEPPVIDNDTLIEIKGFCPKTSFRKAKRS